MKSRIGTDDTAVTK